MMPWSLARWQGPCCWDRPGNVPRLLSIFIMLEGAMEAAGGKTPTLLLCMVYDGNARQKFAR